MLFGGFISSYIILRAGSDYFQVPSKELLGIPLASLNTAILVTSSIFMMLAMRSIRKSKSQAMIRYLFLTLLMAAGFIGIKLYEYHHKWHEGITIVSGLFGSFYYTLTGLHVLHMIGGMIFISYIICNASKGLYNAEHHARVEYASFYWYFVDFLWLILFPLFYLL